MSNVAIRVEGLGKQYRIGGKQERYRTLRDTLTDTLTAPFKRTCRLRGQTHSAAALENTFWALKNVSFEVKHGEVVGIIGRNGAGKSTLLKILSRITEPTEGYADLYGRIGSLLEVGTGFHPELTGRENIYLNGAILGMSRREMNRKFDEIVAFAEVEEFIDTPVKHYSSGMGLRLGFSVAAHLEPEILIVDEVLAVGDVSFQKKCLGKMGEVAGEGRTVLFVSHNMAAVESLCGTSIWLDRGQLRLRDESSQVVSQYMVDSIDGILPQRSDPIQIMRVILRNGKGEQTITFYPGDDIEVIIHYSATQTYYRPYFWISVNGKTGGICAANMLLDGQSPEYIRGEGILGCRFKSLPLLPQPYSLKMGIRAADGRTALCQTQDVASFFVVGDVAKYGLVGEMANAIAPNSVPLILPYEWLFPNGVTVPIRITTSDEGA